MDIFALEQHFHPALSEGDNQPTADEPIHELTDDLPTQIASKNEQPTSSLPSAF